MLIYSGPSFQRFFFITPMFPVILFLASFGSLLCGGEGCYWGCQIWSSGRCGHHLWVSTPTLCGPGKCAPKASKARPPYRFFKRQHFISGPPGVPTSNTSFLFFALLVSSSLPPSLKMPKTNKLQFSSIFGVGVSLVQASL